ncbi:hypothetical protein ABN222_08235 [Providencia alcalifaciens]|jgi:ribosomal protein L24E
MVWRVVRIDFTDRQKCNFCSRSITVGFGHVVVNEGGIERYAGPTCVRKIENVTNVGERVPNLTTGFFVEENAAPEEVGIGDNEQELQPNLLQNIAIQNEYNEEAAISYLLLRMEKLRDVTRVRYNALDDVYLRYINNSLSESDFQFIRCLMYSLEYPEFSMRNLQKIYYCKFIIDLLIKENESDSDYLNTVRRYLYNRLRLTTGYVNILNKKLTGKPFKLKENFFTLHI